MVISVNYSCIPEALYFSAMKDNVENALTKGQKASSNQLEKELWHSLAAYMNSEIPYTIKRLLPADLKVYLTNLIYDIKLRIIFDFKIARHCMTHQVLMLIY